MTIRVGSCFSGIEGFGLGLEQAGGFEVVWQIELDDDAVSVLERHYPNVMRVRDIKEASGYGLPAIDLLVGGWPCFVAGTLVLSERGFVPIETLSAGTRVLTHLGRWRAVTSVMKRRADATCIVKGQGAPPIVTTHEHPFFARPRLRSWDNDRRAYLRDCPEPEWVEAAKLDQHYVSQVLPSEHCDEMAEMAAPASFWRIVGRYLADGWTSPRRDRSGGGTVCFGIGKAKAEAFREHLAVAGIHATESEQRTSTRFVVSKKRLYDILQQFGRGAAGKQLPGWVFSLDAERAGALIEGYLDGDGSAMANGNRRATTVSKALALSMALLAQRAYGVVASVHQSDVPTTTIIEGRVVNQRTQYCFSLPPRNRSAFVEGDYGWKLVRSVTNGEGAEVWNISVDGDESYVADGMVVHNCQDLSVAGARAGLAGERSGLFFEIARLARECAAPWVFWENVPGLTSSFSTDNPPPGDLEPGRSWESEETSDLGVVLDTLTELRYGWAFRTLDARYAGVPQRRRRVFFVGCLGDSGVRPAQVLFESDSSPWNPAPSRTKRQGVARDAAHGAGGIGFDAATGAAAGGGARPGALPGMLRGVAGGVREDAFTLLGNRNGTGASDNAWNTTYIPGVEEPPVAAEGGNRASGEIEVATATRPKTHLDFESETFVVDATNGGQSAGVAGTLTTEQAKGNRGQMVVGPLVSGATPNGHGTAGVNDQAVDAGHIIVVSDTVRSHPRPGSNSLGNVVAQETPSVAAPLTAGGHPASNAPGRHREDDENLVVGEVQAFNWQAGGGGNDESFRGKSRQYPVLAGDYTGALSSTRVDAVAIPISSDAAAGRSGDAVTPSPDAEGRIRLRPPSPGIGDEGDPSFTVNASAAPAVAIRTAHQGANGEGLATDQAHTLDGGPQQAIAFHLTQDPINGAESPALGAGNENGCSTIGVAVSENQRAEVRETDYSRQLTTGGGKPGQGYPSVRTGMTVRRLTPMECERLMGLPDNWTKWRADGTEISDGPRYRLIGNSVAVPVIIWIGKRLRAVMEAGQ